MSSKDKQDDYNETLKQCDIFLSLFATKVNKYTVEEFNVAHKQFRASNRPQIFTFFKEETITTVTAKREDLQTLWEFQDKLKKHETFLEHLQEC